MRYLTALLTALALAGCGQVDSDTYKKSGSTYNRSDGFYTDANGALHIIADGTSRANMTQAGAMTFGGTVTADGATTLTGAASTAADFTVGTDLTVTTTSLMTGDVTFAGGAGAITATAASSSLVCLNNSATGFTMGASGITDMLVFDTQTSNEKLIVKGTTTATAFHVDVGTMLVDEAATITGVLTQTGQANLGAGMTKGAVTDMIEKSVKVTLTATQIKAAAAPITVVAAVATKQLVFLGATAKFNTGTEILVEPSAPDDFAFRLVDGSGTIVSDTINSGVLFASAGPVDAYAQFNAITHVAGVAAVLMNVPIVIHNTGGNLTGNASDDATLELWIRYLEVGP